MPFGNINETIKELEAEIAKEGGDSDTIVLPPREDEAPIMEADVGEPDREQEIVAADAGLEETDNIEDDAVSDDAKKRGKAFGQIRSEAKEAKERADAAEKRSQELAERMARLEGREEGRSPQVKVQEDKEPDALLYPDDHNQWKTRQLEARVEKAEKIAQQAASYNNYQSELRGVDVLERQFKAANPKQDYDGAVKFIADREREIKKLMRPDMNDSQIEASIENDKVTLFRTLHQQGRNPAEALVNLAKTYGYTGKPATASATPRANLDRLADNQRKSSNLMGGSPAGKIKTALSSDDIFNMSFENLVKMPNKKRRAIADGDE